MRIYDPRLGRWLSIDPLFKKYPEVSPYNYGLDNPVFYVDPDGGDIKPANDLAMTQLGEVFNAFNTTTDNNRNVRGSDLFGVTGRNVNFGEGSQTVLSTNLTKRQFNRALNKTNLSADQKKEAKAVFKLLSSNDIYEIGTVQQNTQLNGANNGTNQQNKFTTDNEDANRLLSGTSSGRLNNAQIQENLKTQTNSGSTETGGAYGVFPDNQRAQSEDKTLKGAILINTPASSETVISPSNPSSPRGNEPTKETKTIIQGIKGAAVNIPENHD